MAKKVIKKVVQLVITSEKWTSNTNLRKNIFELSVTGEVKNIGMAEVKNAIVIGAVINTKTNNTFQLVNKRLKIYKAADYTILPNIKPGQTLPFEISIHFPTFKSMLFGKSLVKMLEDGIKRDKYYKKAYLSYDENILDDKTIEWFREEDLKKIRFSEGKWSIIKDPASKRVTGFKCKGMIKNSALKEIKDFEILGYMNDSRDKSINFYLDDIEYSIAGSLEINKILSNTYKQFEIICNIPNDTVLDANGYSREKLEEDFKEDRMNPKLTLRFMKKVQSKETYRDIDENPTILEESDLEKIVDKIEERWEENKNEFLSFCKVKNNGAADVENCYVIASLAIKETGQPVTWDSATESLKAISIEKVPYLAIGSEQDLILKFNKPPQSILKNFNLKSESIEKALNTGELEKIIEIYYHKEDVQEEGLKRLRLGNTYYQLNNYRGCLNEYSEGIKLIADYKLFYYNLGLTYYKLNDLVLAEENCKKAVEIDKDCSKALYLLGLILGHSKKRNEAFGYFNRALEIDKDNPKIIYNIGCLHILNKNIPEGINWLKNALKTDKNLIISQLIKDHDLKEAKKDEVFRNFLSKIREESYTS